MTVTNEIKIYETNGKDTLVGENPMLKINSHWNRQNCVVIEIDGKRITVVASQLEKAIQNATNWKS